MGRVAYFEARGHRREGCPGYRYQFHVDPYCSLGFDLVLHHRLRGLGHQTRLLR